jgi:hypothetical protein
VDINSKIGGFSPGTYLKFKTKSKVELLAVMA